MNQIFIFIADAFDDTTNFVLCAYYVPRPHLHLLVRMAPLWPMDDTLSFLHYFVHLSPPSVGATLVTGRRG